MSAFGQAGLRADIAEWPSSQGDISAFHHRLELGALRT
jgi:hypothetical protein